MLDQKIGIKKEAWKEQEKRERREKNQRARLQIIFDCSTRSMCWQGESDDLIYWHWRGIEREQAERHARQNKFNHLVHHEENLSLSLAKDPPGLNQLQTNLILRRDTGGINSSFQFNSASRRGKGKLSSITFMCLARQLRCNWWQRGTVNTSQEVDPLTRSTCLQQYTAGRRLRTRGNARYDEASLEVPPF